MGSTPIGRAILCIDLIYIREVAQLGRALGLGPRGRRFESCLPDFLNNSGALLSWESACFARRRSAVRSR